MKSEVRSGILVGVDLEFWPAVSTKCEVSADISGKFGLKIDRPSRWASGKIN